MRLVTIRLQSPRALAGAGRGRGASAKEAVVAGLRGFSACLLDPGETTCDHSPWAETKTIGFQFCCLIWRLRFLCLHFLGVTSRAIICCLSQSVLEGSANRMHLSSNKSNHSQGNCEREVKLASSLDFWTLFSENLILCCQLSLLKKIMFGK